MNLVKEQRKKRGYTQQELADKAEVSIKTIQGIEQNRRKPGTVLLLKIFKILDIPFENIEFFLQSYQTK